MELEPQTAIESIAVITKRSSLLSHSLSDISSGLVDSPITPAINAVAQEFAELADLAKQLGELLTVLTKTHIVTEKLLDDAGKALSRLDRLVRAFEAEINDSGPHRAPRRFKNIFKSENISDLTWTCRSVKEPLRLNISVLRIAHDEQQRKRQRKKKHVQDVTALSRESELAESWVEASRQVIKALLSSERRVQKRSAGDILQLRHWNETFGATALWVYNLIFTRALKSLPATRRFNARGGRVRTIRTADGNATASDSEQDEITDHIPPDLERELYVTAGVKRGVVNELLETWVGLDPGPIRQITDGVRNKDKSRVQDSVSRIIRWYIENEKTAPEEESPQPTRDPSRGRSQRREQDGGDIRGTNRSKEDGSRRMEQTSGEPPPKVPTPPTSPKVTPSEKTNGVKKDAGAGEGAVGAKPDEGAQATATPKAGSPSRPSSPETIVLPPPAHPPTKLEERKKEAPFTVTASDSVTKKGERSYTIYIAPSAREKQGSSTKKSVVPKDDAVVVKRSQSSKRAPNEQNSTKEVNFVQDDRRTQHRKDEYHSSDGFASEARQRGRRRSLHETDRATHTGVPGDASSRNGPRHASSRLHPASTMFPDTTNPRSNNSLNPFGMGGHYGPTQQIHMQAPPASAPSGLGPGRGYHRNSMPPVASSGYYPTHAQQNGGPEDGKNARLTELQQRMDDRDKEERAREQARKDEAEARKEEGRRRAQEEERRIAAQRQEVEELRRRIQDLQESGRRNEQRWEEEKRSIERRIEETRISEEQANRRAEEATETTQSTNKTEDRLWEFIASLQENERRRTDEWAKERDSIFEEAHDQIQRAVEEGEEEKQAAIKGLISEYEEKLKAEQQKVEQANVRAERYVTLYNGLVTAGRENVGAMSGSTKASERAPDPFAYYDKHQHSSSASSMYDGSAMETETTEPRTVPWDEQNPWADRSPYERFAPQDRTRRYTASVATRSSDEASNVIVFPPRAGWSEFGPNQLGNYLSSSGFKAMFEERERPSQHATGRFEKIGTGGNVLRGTLFWQPPASTAEADLYKSLRNCGWRPTYVRTTISGQTWFFGGQPVHAQFFSDMYKPQVTPFDISRATRGSEKESLIISKDLVEVEELDFLGHMYKEQDGKIFLDPTLTPEDIDHIVARSFLAREGRYRKKFRNSSLRFSPPKMDIMEVASEAGDSVSEASSGSKERRLSLWPFWGTWSSS